MTLRGQVTVAPRKNKQSRRFGRIVDDQAVVDERFVTWLDYRQRVDLQPQLPLGIAALLPLRSLVHRGG